MPACSSAVPCTLTLTEAGQRVLGEAVKIAEAAFTVDKLAGELQGQIKGKLRVTCSSGLGKA